MPRLHSCQMVKPGFRLSSQPLEGMSQPKPWALLFSEALVIREALKIFPNWTVGLGD